MFEAVCPFIIMSALQIAYQVSFSSCPNTSRRASGLSSCRKILLCNRQHTTCTTGAVVKGFHNSFLSQHITVIKEQKVDHQANNFTGCANVLPAVSLELSANFRINSSKTYPISILEIRLGCKSIAANFSVTKKSQILFVQVTNFGFKLEHLQNFTGIA